LAAIWCVIFFIVGFANFCPVFYKSCIFSRPKVSGICYGDYVVKRPHTPHS